MRGLLPTLYCPLIVMMYLHSVADHKAGQGPLLSNAVDNCKLVLLHQGLVTFADIA